MSEIQVSILQNNQNVGVNVSGGTAGVEVIHDETLKGKGQRSAPLGIADSVLENIDSKVSNVKVNGETVVTDTVADITIGDATLTIQKNGEDIDTFTANALEDKTVNIIVPTKTSDITNDSDYQNGTEVANSIESAISTHNTANNAHSNLLTPITESITANANAISAEELRATTAEGGLQGQITDNKNTMDGHIANTSNPHSVTKAQVGLGNCDNTSDADKPISTATQTALDTKATPADITSAISTHNSAADAHSNIITPITNDISIINGKIPSQASTTNQLADKNFVNSSVATNTANFIGTFNSVADLEAYTGTVTNNDYAFVIDIDSVGNTIYNRYKYTTATTPASWQFEYALNNSSFTSDQWAAINSGATTTNIGQIATNTTTISGHIADKNNPHEVTKTQVGLGNVDNTSDLNKPISTATQTALNLKADKATTLAGYGITDAYTKTATDTLLNAKADTDLNNLTSTGANIGNWSSNVSNCIVEIPQDINLTLSSGTLTLKAGSKLTKPNGTTVSVSSDLTHTFNTDGTYVLYSWGGSSLNQISINRIYSGTTAPSGSGKYLWFDTANNIIKETIDGGSTWNGNICFPIAIYIVSGGAISSIDQVFNGFGYIGSTVFALPGVKALTAAGRKTNGTLNNILVTLDSVKTVSSTLTRSGKLGIQNTGNLAFFIDYSYDEEKNRVYNYGIQTAACAGDLVYNAGRVESLKIRPVFHAVDYSDYAQTQSQVSTNTSNIATLNSNVVKTSGNQTISGIKVFSAKQINVGSGIYREGGLEFTPSSSSTNGGYIDFHYAGSTADYTSRIIEDASGHLTFTASKGSSLSVSPADNDSSKKIATTEFVNNVKDRTISNCLLEVPQNINLTLSNGTLTLKAGSKVYVPNGSGVFNTINITSDKTFTYTANGQYLIVVTANGDMNRCSYPAVSGTTEPTASAGTLWYDTANNLVKRNDGTQWQNRSFPIAIITVSGGAISSIDQVFNGFGYIGSTIFALPGVRGLIPNGRNADGSLNNILTTPATTVKTSTTVSGNTGRKTMTINSSGVIDRPGGLEYNERENRNYNFGSPTGQCICGYFTVGSDYKITDFVVKTPFHAVDYSDYADTVAKVDTNTSNIATLDSSVVKLTGNQTIGGTKTFSSSPVAPTPSTTDNSTKVATTEYVTDVLKAIYPVGSIYIGTQNSCPMSAFFGTWELVSSGKALWTGNGTNGNTTISAGLPNITGSIGYAENSIGGVDGAFYKGGNSGGNCIRANSDHYQQILFDASRSSNIYGNSDTVQPPAYVVNVWRRTA